MDRTALCAQRRLTNHFSAAGRASIAQRVEEKIKIKQENEVAAIAKAEQCQEEVASGNKHKKKRVPSKDC